MRCASQKNNEKLRRKTLTDGRLCASANKWTPMFYVQGGRVRQKSFRQGASDNVKSLTLEAAIRRITRIAIRRITRIAASRVRGRLYNICIYNPESGVSRLRELRIRLYIITD